MKFDLTKTGGPLRTAADFLVWVIYACAIGLIVGTAGVAFHYGVDWAVQIRGAFPWLIWLLPLGGVAIIWIYRICGMEQDRGTNLVLLAVRTAEPMKLRTAPLIFLSTVLTHLLGGSAGREGAALQLGGSMGAWIGRRIHLDEKSSRVMVMCGMSAAFSALFGTPLTAAVFSMEVVSVGVMYYAALVPSLLASIVSYQLAVRCGLHMGEGYLVTDVSPMNGISMIQVAALGALCALLSILFCQAMHKSSKLYQKLLPNSMLRVAVGGALVLGLTLLVGNQTYSGAGDPVIHRMLAGETIPTAFIMKILFTALTLGAGFRGGEIVPALFTGCAFGTLAGPMLGLSHSFGGALGMAAIFCGATNCPLSSIFLAYELFGGSDLPLYALCCATSYMLSGYYGLYSEQKILYSKFSPYLVNRNAE